MKQLQVGIIGTGWCGAIRAAACRSSALVAGLHVAEIEPQHLERVSAAVQPETATSNYHELLERDEISTFMISATPEETHYPMARDCLSAGRHVLLEKPMALELHEADALIDLAKSNQVKFTIGYSQRFNPKFVYVKKAINDGSLGKPVSALISRHIVRSLGEKIRGRAQLSQAAMEATHDIDFALWCLQPAKPIRVYSQAAYGVMEKSHNTSDTQTLMITMDSGAVVTVGAGWTLPPSYPNYSGTWIEFAGTKGVLVVDDTHRECTLHTEERGVAFPMSSMPGEQVEHVFAGPMATETQHFLESVAYDRPVLVTPEQARQVMELYLAADLSVDRNEPVSLPMSLVSNPVV